MQPVLAATTGGIDLSSVQNLIQSLADGLSTLILPLGIVGIVVGAAMVLIGYHHGANTIRSSALAIVIGGLAKVIATALAGAAGGTTNGGRIGASERTGSPLPASPFAC